MPVGSQLPPAHMAKCIVTYEQFYIVLRMDKLIIQQIASADDIEIMLKQRFERIVPFANPATVLSSHRFNNIVIFVIFELMIIITKNSYEHFIDIFEVLEHVRMDAEVDVCVFFF